MENKNQLLTRGEFSEEMGKMAVMIQKGFDGITKDIADLSARMDKFERYCEKRFDAIGQELKDIRKQLSQADTRAEVVDLELRVSKLEKKAHFKA